MNNGWRTYARLYPWKMVLYLLHVAADWLAYHCMRDRTIQRLIAEIEALPEPERTAFVLMKCRGLKVPQIAQRMGLTDDEARELLARALVLYRKNLLRKRGTKTPTLAAILVCMLMSGCASYGHFVERHPQAAQALTIAAWVAAVAIIADATDVEAQPAQGGKPPRCDLLEQPGLPACPIGPH